MTDLDLIPTKELMDHLCARFNDVVFIGRRDTPAGRDRYESLFHWSGDYSTCIGLAFQMAREIDDARKETVDDETEMA